MPKIEVRWVYHRLITSTIIAMAKTLRMQVIAEGVETAEQMAFLSTRSCDFYQRYYTRKPLPAAEFEGFFQKYTLIKI